MVATFEPGERTERAYALMETMRMIVTQILVPKVGGGRQALREYLVFTDEIREKFLGMKFDDWPVELINTVRNQGMMMVKSARKAYEDGLIDVRHYNKVARGTGEELAE
jgi:defect-in-organelle-trafficking protein DotB